MSDGKTDIIKYQSVSANRLKDVWESAKIQKKFYVFWGIWESINERKNRR